MTDMFDKQFISEEPGQEEQQEEQQENAEQNSDVQPSVGQGNGCLLYTSRCV